MACGSYKSGVDRTGPLAAMAYGPKTRPAAEELDWRTKTGRILPGVDLRIVDGEPGSRPGMAGDRRN